MIGQRATRRISNFFWPQPLFEIKPGQSVILIGRPGTGKSTFLRWLLKESKSVVVYDSKYDPDEWLSQPDYVNIEKVSELGRYPRVVLKCPLPWLLNREEWETINHPWGIALEHPIKRTNTIAAFDEALATWPNRGGHPGTHRLIQQSRSFNVILIIGSQLANNIDTRILRMANHVLVFGPCKNQNDLDYILNATSIDTTPLTKLRKHEIAWWSDESSQWILFRRIRVKRLRKLRRKKETLGLSRWLMALVLILVMYWLISVLIGTAQGVLACSTLAIYLLVRVNGSRSYQVKIESREWIPQLEDELVVDNDVRKRPPKTFRLS